MRFVCCAALAIFIIASTVAAQTGSVTGAAQYSDTSPSPRGPLQTTSGKGFVGAPYSGKETTTDTKTAADGTKYSNTFETQLWRDSEGRTREERLETSPSGGEQRGVIITDPVAGVYLKWTIGDAALRKAVTIWALPNRERVTGPPLSSWPDSAPPSGSSQPRPCGKDCTIQFERLPSQEINGVFAKGTRWTRTFPAGTAENGQSLMATVTNELWISPDLRIIVRHVTEDSRTGTNRTEVTDVMRGESDPSLFVAPEGYEIRDMRQRPTTNP